METCPRCNEQTLEQKVSVKVETQPDPGRSLVMGAALDIGYFPMTKLVTIHITEYTCGRCGYYRRDTY